MLEVPNRAGTFASVDSLRIGHAGNHILLLGQKLVVEMTSYFVRLTA